jgi:hypothetical protein
MALHSGAGGGVFVHHRRRHAAAPPAERATDGVDDRAVERSTFTAPATIALSATAADSDGAVIPASSSIPVAR